MIYYMQRTNTYILGCVVKQEAISNIHTYNPHQEETTNE